MERGRQRRELGQQLPINFTGGRSFSTISPLVNTIYFADTNGFKNAVTNNTISVQSAGVSAGTLVFQNNSVNYTFNDSSGTTGITGTTALVKTGSGTVTLAGANSLVYWPDDFSSAGTLALGNSNALAGGGSITFAGGDCPVWRKRSRMIIRARFSTAPGPS